jgi:dienelactone hydrolase
MRQGLGVLVLLGLLAGCASKGVGGSRPVPLGPPTGIGVYSREPLVLSAKISPKGTYLALRVVENGQIYVAFREVASGKFIHMLRPSATTMVRDFWWVSDERVVASTISRFGGADQPGDSGELFAINANGGNGFLVYGYRAVDRSGARRAGGAEWGSARFVGRAGDDRSIIIAVTRWEDSEGGRQRLDKLDTYTGARTQLINAPIAYADFLTDETGFPRIAVGGPFGKEQYFYRDASGDSWKLLDLTKGVTPHSVVTGFVAHDRLLYVVDDAPDGGLGLFGVHIDTGVRELLWKSDLVEPSGLVKDLEGRVVAVESEPDLPTYDFLVAEHPKSRLLTNLLAAFPGKHVAIESTTQDVSKAVVVVYSDRDPGQFFLVDVATLTATYLTSARTWIDPEKMAEQSAFRIKASDGRMIHGYFTLPRDRLEGTAVPLVVLPHGGPIRVRDHWGFDPEVQLLANEGYAVLQVNYRGSGGYGVGYEEAGFRHWGDRIQQDIIEATRFLVRKGFADPKHVCIYGTSFGGYAAMQSAILAPDLFRCAVGYAGAYDLALLTDLGDTALTRYGRDYLKITLGDDAAALAAASPAKNASRLQARVMLIHGGKDERCPVQNAEAMRAALEKEGKTVEWLLEPDEGHGFRDELTRERMYTRLLTFLRTSLREPERPPAAAAASTRP